MGIPRRFFYSSVDCANVFFFFRSYDASAHLAEETNDASETVAKGMWAATLSAWLLSVPVGTPFRDHPGTM